jgi:Mlc titration factor MtfA (ptsG expression regulator)
VPGAFLADRNKVVVATIPRSQTDPTRIVPPSGQGHGSVNLVLHETGHSLDYKGGRASSISRTDKAFIAAYNQDKAGMEPYFQQPPPAGPEEAFAETLALHYSGNPDFATAHPALAAYWNEHPPFGPGGGPS